MAKFNLRYTYNNSPIAAGDRSFIYTEGGKLLVLTSPQGNTLTAITFKLQEVYHLAGDGSRVSVFDLKYQDRNQNLAHGWREFYFKADGSLFVRTSFDRVDEPNLDLIYNLRAVVNAGSAPPPPPPTAGDVETDFDYGDPL